MSQELAKLFNALNDVQLRAFAGYEQDRANELQGKARKAQREADAARKELRRRQLAKKAAA